MLKFICFSACVVVASAAPSAAPLAWTDCATDKANTVLTVHDFDFHPNPIIFPGELHFTINVTINKIINQFSIDTELRKQVHVFGVWLLVPCIGDTNIGSCQNIDGCNVLDRILNVSSVISADLGQQIDMLLQAALGHQATCPINPETVVIHNQKITLQPLPTLLGAIGDGDYNVKIMLKDDPTNTDNVGCLSFNAGISREASSLIGDGVAVGKK